jgi:pyruvate decarboxylase
MIHHTFKPSQDHLTYVKMEEPINKAQAVLLNDATMADEIDRVIIECVKSRLPVTIYVPMDSVSVPLDATRLQTPLDITIKNDPETEDRLVPRILEEIKKASNPSILADVLGIRHGAREVTRKLVELTHFPGYSTPLSKGIIDETSPFYNGLYNGEGIYVALML